MPKLSYMWNLGSFLGICMGFQVLTGVFLTFGYSLSFSSLQWIMRDSFFGSLLNFVHANLASVLFFLLFFHILKGLLFFSARIWITWVTGSLIILLTMGVAFLGYVLPWGQMSFWGATVITNLISAIPKVGGAVVIWVWGGFSVSGPTLNVFYSLHYLVPFIILAAIVSHLLTLHTYTSTSLSGVSQSQLHPFWARELMIKDTISMVLLIVVIGVLSIWPDSLGDSENYNKANSLASPLHIKPEWYFLFAYAILRSIPSKGLGVLGLVASVFILFAVFMKTSKNISLNVTGVVLTFILLSWIGGQVVEIPYIFVGQMVAVLYFLAFFVYPL